MDLSIKIEELFFIIKDLQKQVEHLTKLSIGIKPIKREVKEQPTIPNKNKRTKTWVPPSTSEKVKPDIHLSNKFEILNQDEIETAPTSEDKLENSNRMKEGEISRFQTNKNLLKFIGTEEDKVLSKIFNDFPNFILVEPKDFTRGIDNILLLEKNIKLKEVLETFKKLRPLKKELKIIQNDKTNDYSIITNSLYKQLYEETFPSEQYPINSKEKVYSDKTISLFKKRNIKYNEEEPLRNRIPTSTIVIKTTKERIQGRPILNPRGKPISFLCQKYQQNLKDIFKLNFGHLPYLSQNYSTYHSHPKIMNFISENKGRVYCMRTDIRNCYPNTDLTILKKILLGLKRPNIIKIDNEELNYETFIDEVMEISTQNQFLDKTGRVLEMNKGLCLGGKLSPILVEILVECIIQNILRDKPELRRKIKIIRTVDDFLIFTLDLININEPMIFCKEFEKHSNYELKIEEEINNKTIIFLGVRYDFQNLTSIYKFKETSYHLLPSFFSMNSLENKKMKIKGMIYYVIIFTTQNEVIEKQKELIDKILMSKDYPPDLIDDIWNEVRLKINNHTENRFIPLKFEEEIENKENTNFSSNLMNLFCKTSNYLLGKWTNIFNSTDKKLNTKNFSFEKHLKTKTNKPFPKTNP